MVGEVGENELRWATMVAARRKLFLEGVSSAMRRDGITGGKMTAFAFAEEHQQELTQ